MEKIQETEDGYYVRVGDVLEWKWKGGEASSSPVSTSSASEVVKPKRKTRKTTKTARKK